MRGEHGTKSVPSGFHNVEQCQFSVEKDIWVPVIHSDLETKTYILACGYMMIDVMFWSTTLEGSFPTILRVPGVLAFFLGLQPTRSGRLPRSCRPSRIPMSFVRFSTGFHTSQLALPI